MKKDSNPYTFLCCLPLIWFFVFLISGRMDFALYGLFIGYGIVIVCAIIDAIIGGGREYSRAQNAQANLLKQNVDQLTGVEFEHYCAQLLLRNHFQKVSYTKASGDHGADLIAYRDGLKFAIQCKCYKRSVGNKAIQEVITGKLYYNADFAIVMTNNYFTKQARDEAQKLNVMLWDRNIIRKM